VFGDRLEMPVTQRWLALGSGIGVVLGHSRVHAALIIGAVHDDGVE
jgi:hypothetical protein